MTTTEARPVATVLQLCLRNGNTAGGVEKFLLYSEFSTPFDSIFSPISLTFAAVVVPFLSKTYSV